MAAQKKRKTKPKRKIGKISTPHHRLTPMTWGSVALRDLLHSSLGLRRAACCGAGSRRKKKKTVFRKIAKFHALFTGVVLASYLAVGFWLGPGALKQDIEGKVAGASTFLSLHITGPPGKPDVTNTAGCNGNNPYIIISWEATTDTDSYDVYRDGALLVSGITNMHYNDENVVSGTTYDYYVVANGPLGSTQSDTISKAAPGGCYVPSPEITSIGNIDPAAYDEVPEINERDPVISGIAGMPYAKVQIEIYSESLISSLITADENGYWEWKVPKELDYGLHTLYVTVIDPGDDSNFKTTRQDFIITGGVAPPPPPPPENVVCRIMTLDKIDLTNFRCLPVTKKKKPVFSGTVNVSNARIQAEISTSSAKRKVISSFSANENGYWSWGVRGQLKKGTKNIYVKATDPNDASRFATCSLRFKIGKAYSRKKMKKCAGAVAYRTLFVPPGYKFSKSLALQFSNSEKSVFTGDTIEFEADFKDAFPSGTSEQKINFQLVDSKNNTVYQVEKNKSPDKNGKISESIKVPLYAGSGRYKVIAQTAKGDELVTVEKDIAVKEKPVIELSSNWSLTHAELLSSLGWIAIVLTTALLIFFGLLVFEYHLSQYAVFQVTEGELKKDGYID